MIFDKKQVCPPEESSLIMSSLYVKINALHMVLMVANSEYSKCCIRIVCLGSDRADCFRCYRLLEFRK
jgi:hypothetical protein